MSQTKPGTSINFDAQALHDAEEAEYHREEREREHEVSITRLYSYHGYHREEREREHEVSITRLYS